LAEDQVVNLTQGLVVAFIISAWLALIVIFIAQPSLYDSQLQRIGLAGQPSQRAASLWRLLGCYSSC
jgi:hypothetical protein